MIDGNELQKILPQDYPFIMIDRVEEFEKGRRLRAIKNVTGNEWSMAGGATDITVFPEMLIVEAASQAALALYKLSFEDSQKKSQQFFLDKTNAQFHKPVEVGDQLDIEILVGKMLASQGYVSAVASVAGNKVAEVEIFYSVKS